MNAYTRKPLLVNIAASVINGLEASLYMDRNMSIHKVSARRSAQPIAVRKLPAHAKAARLERAVVA